MSYLAAADPALSNATSTVTSTLTDNAPAIIGVVAAFLGTGVLINLIKGLRGKAKV